MASIEDIRTALEKNNEKCSKIRYDTRKAARWAVMRHWKVNRKIGSIYYCHECESFHLTKRKPGKSKFRFL